MAFVTPMDIDGKLQNRVTDALNEVSREAFGAGGKMSLVKNKRSSLPYR